MKTHKNLMLIILFLAMIVLTMCSCSNNSAISNDQKNTYTMSFESNGGSTIADITVSKTVQAQLPLTTRIGYEFDGWYEDNNSWSKPFNYTFINGEMLSSDLVLYAKWIPNQYEITFNKQGGSGESDSVIASYGSPMPTALAPQKAGYIFGGYYLSEDGTGYPYYSLSMDSYKTFDCLHNVTLYAKWLPIFTQTENYIFFGEYPQTIKDSNVDINEKADAKGYYFGDDGERYVKVSAKHYEFDIGYRFSSGEELINGNIYYFKVEPIKWQILENSSGTLLLLSNVILDTIKYDDYLSNYVNSDVREWLNTTFYFNAFFSEQKDYILTTEVDNSAKSTGENINANASHNTYDKVFLLSYEEATNTEYGYNPSYYTGYDFSRTKITTDYSRSKGARTEFKSSSPYMYHGYWMLRSPSSSLDIFNYIITFSGEIYPFGTVEGTGRGIVPAIRIQI